MEIHDNEQATIQQKPDIDHPNILPCLASFVFGYRYHKVYPRFEGHVEKFMQTYQTGKTILSAGKLAAQLSGLTEALSLSRWSELGTMITPEHVFTFIDEQTWWFRVVDYSWVVCNEDVNQGSGKGHFWSLGCFYFELLVWFLEGYNALVTLRIRFRHLKPGIMDHKSFHVAVHKDRLMRDKVRAIVLSRLRNLVISEHEPLGNIANVIPNLLEIEPNDRLTMERLMTELKRYDAN